MVTRLFSPRWLAISVFYLSTTAKCPLWWEFLNEGISTVDNMSNVEMRRDLSALQSSVSAMSSSIDQLAQQLSGIASRFPSSPPILDVSSSKSGPPTYADVVSASFVKAAVSEAIREHQQISANEVCIAVYGFPEEGHDKEQLQEMFDYLGCACCIVGQSRVGLSARSNLPRPIKLELKSATDANLLLSKARFLRRDDYYTGVFINKWLTQDEAKRVKHLREWCNSLNKKHPGKSGRKDFVVISGELKKRDSSGSLQPVDPSLWPPPHRTEVKDTMSRVCFPEGVVIHAAKKRLVREPDGFLSFKGSAVNESEVQRRLVMLEGKVHALNLAMHDVAMMVTVFIELWQLS
jgi:hypothetical protein